MTVLQNINLLRKFQVAIFLNKKIECETVKSVIYSFIISWVLMQNFLSVFSYPKHFFALTSVYTENITGKTEGIDRRAVMQWL